MAEILIPFVNSLVILDAEGSRLLAKYYDGRSKADQKTAEATLHKKSKAVAAKSAVEVMLVDNELVVFKSGSDCRFFLSGPLEENELIMVEILDCFFDTVYTLLKGQVDKRTMLDNLELVLLSIDEALDSGHIMELDSLAIVNRVLMQASETHQQGHGQQAQTIGELSISQALGLARDQLFKGPSGPNAEEMF